MTVHVHATEREKVREREGKRERGREREREKDLAWMGPVARLEVAHSARNERTVFPCFLVRPTWLCHAVFAGH